MDPEGISNFREGEPHPTSRGEQILFRLQQELGYFYDFEFNVAIGCDRGFDEFESRELGIAWITPDLVHHQAKFAVEVDGIQHRFTGSADDDERDVLLTGEGWVVLRIPSYEIYDENLLLGALDRIQRGVFTALLEKDAMQNVIPDLWRCYPIAVRCSNCDKSRPGHRVGSGFLCIHCLASISDGPYLPPHFECSYCGRKMEDPNDVDTWARIGEPRVSFQCPEECLEVEDERSFD
jgi:hypothetical protein